MQRASCSGVRERGSTEALATEAFLATPVHLPGYKWIWPRVVPDPGWLRETPLFTFLAASLASWSSPDRPKRPGPAQGPPGANAPPSAAAHAVYAARAGRIWPKPGPF